ncbi:sialate O-acetylesterase, partial [Larkinella soli]|uniref:sialate O-acetylesterase n=1 Tax=Larkinella soli TaxID=1770527 RepID=UPI0013E36731
DVFLFNGQSNITEYYPSNYTYHNIFVRTFGNSATFPADTLWRLSNIQEGQVGLIGTELQRLILETYNMPTCIINGALGGSSMQSHVNRNPANPADPKTLYGRLLFWARKAGVANRIKAFVWRQGENEAGGSSTTGYEAYFNTLFTNWQADYPNLGKCYIAQLNLLPDANKGAGPLRDFQRRVPELYPRTETIATVGLPGYDGVHYRQVGHFQFARELFRLIARDFYKSSDGTGISSPSIRKAYYRTAEQKEVVLEFDTDHRMTYTKDTLVKNPDGSQSLLDIRDFIYFDYNNGQQNRLIDTITVEANKVILKLKRASQAKDLTYLPNFYKTPFPGPFIRNQRGMRALTFCRFPIGPAPSGSSGTETPPPPPPVDPPANPANGNYQGYIDAADCGLIRGWVYDKNRPDAVVTLELLSGSTVVATLSADQYREDLRKSGKGNGLHGYGIVPPASLKNGLPQSIRLRVKNTTYFLFNGPKVLTCAGAPAPPDTVVTPPPPPPPPPPPVDPPANPANGNYEGFFERADCGSLGGWVFNKNLPNAVVTVEILANNGVVGTVSAGDFRQDLKNAGKGNGQHSFTFALPPSLRNGQVQTLTVRVKDTAYLLKNGPRRVTCAPGARLNAEAAPVEEPGLIASPNPTDGPLTLRFRLPAGQEGELRVTDLNGRTWWKAAVRGTGQWQEERGRIAPGAGQWMVVTLFSGSKAVVKRAVILR